MVRPSVGKIPRDKAFSFAECHDRLMIRSMTRVSRRNGASGVKP
jgi:hypothetical protein